MVTARRVAGVTVAWLLVLAPAVIASETRTFDGVGSAGMTSEAQFYLLEGEYRHGIEVDPGCALTAGVFPADRQPTVLVADVLQADLAIDAGRAGPTGVFAITQAGWATVQVGTGPSCAWRYSISGEFLPPGREPGPPGALRQPWVLWLAIAAAAAVVWHHQRRRPPRAPAEPAEAPRVTVIDA